MVDGNLQLTKNVGTRIAPGARTAAIIAGVVAAAAAVTLAARQNQPVLLLGLIPAATIAGAILAFGLRRWPMTFPAWIRWWQWERRWGAAWGRDCCFWPADGCTGTPSGAA